MMIKNYFKKKQKNMLKDIIKKIELGIPLEYKELKFVYKFLKKEAKKGRGNVLQKLEKENAKFEK